MAACIRFSIPRLGVVSRSRSVHLASINKQPDNGYKFVICGGGAGGLAVASSLARRFGEKQVAVIEPSDVS